MLPHFQLNGLLPEGLHAASEAEALERFGEGSPERRRLGQAVSRWLRLCHSSGAKRFCLNGSFVTAKPSPSDADAVVLLGDDVNERIARGHVDAILLADVLGARPGDHLFAAESRRDWDDWIDFFTRTVDPAVRKGLVEVVL